MHWLLHTSCCPVYGNYCLCSAFLFCPRSSHLPCTFNVCNYIVSKVMRSIYSQYTWAKVNIPPRPTFILYYNNYIMLLHFNYFAVNFWWHSAWVHHHQSTFHACSNTSSNILKACNIPNNYSGYWTDSMYKDKVQLLQNSNAYRSEASTLILYICYQAANTLYITIMGPSCPNMVVLTAAGYDSQPLSSYIGSKWTSGGAKFHWIQHSQSADERNIYTYASARKIMDALI